ncbi:MAG TPA: DUF4198 domain-containing protein [Steroidobacteraceae bacterium]|jgi:uncharacterized GH25 family protein
MNARFALLLFALCFARDGVAHAFWVQPGDFWLNPHAALSWTLEVGDAFTQQPSPLPAHRITRFEAVGPGGAVQDLRAGPVRLAAPGAYVMVLETDNRAYSHQSALRFNDYLEAEGLTPALEDRTRTHRMHADGFERYSRVAKSIVLVGSRDGHGPDSVLRPFGLRLEIVPMVSPYALPRPAQLPVRTLYAGQPLRGALIKLLSLDGQLAVADEQRTNAAGVATFAMPQGGNWLVSVVWTRPLKSADDADYETTFSSLTFGVPRAVSAR